MIIPKKLKIWGLEWEVKENQDVANEGNCFGSTHSRTSKIFLEKDVSQQIKETTILHEILHAIWWQVGLAERFKKIEGITEEQIISSIDTALYQVLKDNNLLK